eukprot:gnl/MRDRNA2_/MRDRNA2_76610_c0_seq1.p1 gnl/MRDRNA2_/MRDRNA2_76610_c0~~gnl/MRDRNA2_/MRDRNA2_76610_c0_seq1.p1  ORF type:complete len:785 (+),score=188.49 gnl/MRDRNA2_/MRDRNA2_76610_c0_seq1:283-2355(+)
MQAEPALAAGVLEQSVSAEVQPSIVNIETSQRVTKSHIELSFEEENVAIEKVNEECAGDEKKDHTMLAGALNHDSVAAENEALHGSTCTLNQEHAVELKDNPALELWDEAVAVSSSFTSTDESDEGLVGAVNAVEAKTDDKDDEDSIELCGLPVTQPLQNKPAAPSHEACQPVDAPPPIQDASTPLLSSAVVQDGPSEIIVKEEALLCNSMQDGSSVRRHELPQDELLQEMDVPPPPQDMMVTMPPTPAQEPPLLMGMSMESNPEQEQASQIWYTLKNEQPCYPEAQTAQAPNEIKQAAPGELSSATQSLRTSGPWEVTLTKNSPMDGYGFTQESEPRDKLTPKGWPEFLIIGCVMKDGLLDAWNQAHPDAEVQPGDRIIKVDACKGVKAMEKALLRNQIQLTIHRFPEQFDVLIRKEGRRLGLKVENPADDSSELRIMEVLKDGCIPEWNASAMKAGEWHRVILAGMLLKAANHAEWDAYALADEMKVAEELQLIVRRADQVSAMMQSSGVFQPASPSSGFQPVEPQILVNAPQQEYKVVHKDGANVRREYNPNSKSLSTLAKGTLVTVEKIVDRRAYITTPIEGWVSTYSLDGKLILELRQQDGIPPSQACPRNFEVTHKNGAQVRAAYDKNSKSIQVIPTGSIVTVVEIRDRRAHIVKPIDGWVSTCTKEDIEILSPLGESSGSPSR